MRLRVAKVDEQAIAQILRHIAIEGLDRRHRGPLVGAHHGPVVFWIKPLSEARRVDQIAEQYRQRPPFGTALDLGNRLHRHLHHLGPNSIRGRRQARNLRAAALR